MTRKTIILTILLLSAACFGAACGVSQSGNANSTNASGAGNSNSGKKSTQLNTTPVTIGVDDLMTEFKTDPMVTYEKYKERMMTVTGKLKSVKFVDSASEAWSVRLQTPNGSDDDYEGNFACLNKVGFSTADLYRSLEIKLDGLKKAGQLDDAPTVTVRGLYRSMDDMLFGSPPKNIELAPCDLVGAPD